MRHFENIIIGFGKAGKTLAYTLAQHGQEVLLIEKDAGMYGGTCINVACLPTKNLILSAEAGVPYDKALTIKNDMTAMLRNKNYHKVADQETATVLTATASFVDDHTLEVTDTSGTETLTADRFFINTGSTPIIPDIPGLATSARVFTSKTLMDQTVQAKKLAILGSGPIGLEFASMYAHFGSEVTVLTPEQSLLARTEPEIAAQAVKDMESDGITFMTSAHLEAVTDGDDGLTLTVDGQTLTADALLVATGRRANTDFLHLERTSVATDKRGTILVNDVLQTNVPRIWALGDVAGSPQFTYIALDDWRIVADQLFGNGQRTTKNRPVFGNTIFLKPAIASVGQTEAQLKAAGIAYRVGRLATAAVPKSQVIGDPRGSFKVLVDPETHLILGATIYAEESYETINVIALAMQHHLPFEALRDQIYTHPTMTEALNDAFDLKI